MLNMRHYVIPIYKMIDRYTFKKKKHMKIFMSDVSVYNTHADFRSDFRGKKCVLYAENYGTLQSDFIESCKFLHRCAFCSYDPFRFSHITFFCLPFFIQRYKGCPYI